VIRFRDTQADGLPMGRQATKTDLVDMARALGAGADDSHSLAQVRALIVAKLPTATLSTSRQATKDDLLGIARALGADLHSRPHATGKNMPVEGLRSWIRTLLIERVVKPARVD
jgi:hypothetical protein